MLVDPLLPCPKEHWCCLHGSHHASRCPARAEPCGWRRHGVLLELPVARDAALGAVALKVIVLEPEALLEIEILTRPWPRCR